MDRPARDVPGVRRQLTPVLDRPIGAYRTADTHHPEPALEAAKLLLAVGQIAPNPRTPRRFASQVALRELAESIKRWGQLQPVVVRHTDIPGRYELICGERRWRAHILAGLPTIWAVVRYALSDEMLPLALVENLHRADLSHAEKIAALDQLAETVHAEGLRNTARYLGIDPGWLSRQLAIRRDPLIFGALEAATIGFGQAAELLRAPEPDREGLLDRLLGSEGRVATATVRAWVADARARRKAAAEEPRAWPDRPSDERREERSGGAVDYDTALAQLRSLRAPATEVDRATLRSIIDCAQSLLAAGEHRATSSGAAQRYPREVTCLLCGSRAGILDGTGRLRMEAAGSVRRLGTSVKCGRCGGSLVSVGQAYAGV